MFSRITIRYKMFFLAFMFGIAFVGYWLYARSVVNTVKIRSSLYQSIVDDKDLVADILPPPLYIIEMYLTAQRMYTENGQFDAHLSRYKTLVGEYNARHEFWNGYLSEGKMHDELLVASYKPAVEFMKVMDQQYIPLVSHLTEENKATAEAVLTGSLRTLYDQHRVAIDSVVALAIADQKTVESRADAIISKSNTTMMVIAVGVLIAALVFSYFFINQIMKSVSIVSKRIAEISQGDGDLTKRLDITTKDELGQLSGNFNQFVDYVETLISKIAVNVQSLSATAQQLASSTQQVNASTQQVTSAVQQVAAGAEELSRQVMQVSDTSRELATDSATAATSANAASKKMESLANAVTQSSATVVSLGDQSQQIVQIVDTINNIASQTNLLALNAAIEAARAGEAGRGFAVVADEVRKLAEESQNSTRQIEDLINGIKNGTDAAVVSMESGKREVEDGGHVVNEALGSLREIGDKIKAIEMAISAVTAVAQQSASSSQQMSAGVQQTSSAMQQVASAAQQLAATAEELQQLISKFKYRGSVSAKSFTATAQTNTVSTGSQSATVSASVVASAAKHLVNHDSRSSLEKAIKKTSDTV